MSLPLDRGHNNSFLSGVHWIGKISSYYVVCIYYSAYPMERTLLLIYASFIAVGGIYLSAKAASTEMKNYYTFDVVIILTFYIMVAFSHQWNFMTKRDELCALQDDFSHFITRSIRL